MFNPSKGSCIKGKTRKIRNLTENDRKTTKQDQAKKSQFAQHMKKRLNGLSPENNPNKILKTLSLSIIR